MQNHTYCIVQACRKPVPKNQAPRPTYRVMPSLRGAHAPRVSRSAPPPTVPAPTHFEPHTPRWEHPFPPARVCGWRFFLSPLRPHPSPGFLFSIRRSFLPLPSRGRRTLISPPSIAGVYKLSIYFWASLNPKPKAKTKPRRPCELPPEIAALTDAAFPPPSGSALFFGTERRRMSRRWRMWTRPTQGNWRTRFGEGWVIAGESEAVPASVEVEVRDSHLFRRNPKHKLCIASPLWLIPSAIHHGDQPDVFGERCFLGFVPRLRFGVSPPLERRALRN